MEFTPDDAREKENGVRHKIKSELTQRKDVYDRPGNKSYCLFNLN